MSFGDSEPAPTYYFSGIIFNPSFYTSASSTYLTQSTAKNYFLSYPLSQGSETFSSNVKLLSTLTDTSGSVGTSGQILSSTTTGVSWITGSGNGYITYNASALPFTLSIPSSSNLFILFTGTASGGIMTLPTIGVANGTYIHVKNNGSGTVNISSSFIRFRLFTPGTASGTTLTASGLITANGGVTIPTGQTLAVVGTQTSTGLITANGGVSGTTLTASGLITGNAGLTLTLGQTLKANTIDTTATSSSMTIGGTIATTNDISLGTNCLIKLKSPSIANAGTAVNPQVAATVTIFGNLMYASVDSGTGPTNYQIPANINRDYYISGTGGVAFTIFLPLMVIHQIIHIRGLNSVYVVATINSGNPTARIYPAVSGGGTFSSYQIQPNTVLNLYCDGTNWIGF